MKTDNPLRPFFIKWFSPPKPKPPKKPFWVLMAIKRLLSKINFILRTTLKILFLIAFVIFVVFWLYVVIQSFARRYYLLGELTPLLFMFGLIVVMMGFGYFFEKLSRPINRVRKQFNEKLRATKAYRVFARGVYTISKIYFERLILSNIDLIEPALIGQESEAFPEVILYKDQQTKTSKQIIEILNNYTNLRDRFLIYCQLGMFLPIIVPFVAWVILEIVTWLVNLITFGFLTTFLDGLVSLLLAVLMLLAFLGWILITTATMMVFERPESMIKKRTFALTGEYYQLLYEEDVRERIEKVERDARILLSISHAKIESIRSKLFDEMKLLGNVQREVTDEFIERVRSLVRENKDEVSFLIQEFQSKQEEDARKRRWKERAFDILVVAIGIGLFVSWLSKILFR